MTKKLFVTGTGTDVGKTFVCGLILKKLHENNVNAGYYKAAVSGNERIKGRLIPGDPAFVKRISGIHQPLDTMVSFVYEEAVSPHLAGKLEGNPVEFTKVLEDYKKVAVVSDYVTLEGSGGIACPLRYDEKSELWLEDVVKEINTPVVIVAKAGLGTINDLVLTVHYLKSKDISIAGIIFNYFHEDSVMERDNLKMVEKRTGIKVIACVHEGDTDLNISLSDLITLYK